MHSLLRWGIENSSTEPGSQAPVRPMQPLDPEIIDLILGKSDAVQMKESLAIAVDTSRDIDQRIAALDNFEMLVEQIDNATNLTPLKMWETLIELSKSNEDEMRQYGLWILGTAVQNNPPAQHAYLAYNPMPGMLAALSANQTTSPSSAATRSKAIYCISNSLRHNARAVQNFDSLGGWKILSSSLEDSSMVVRRKTAFLILTLLLQDGPSSTTPPPVQLPPSVHTNLPAPVPEIGETLTNGLTSRALSSSGIITKLLTSLITPVPHGPDGDVGEPDQDLEEKSVKVVLEYVRLGVGELGAEERDMLGKVLGKVDRRTAGERWGISGSEWEILVEATKA